MKTPTFRQKIYTSAIFFLLILSVLASFTFTVIADPPVDPEGYVIEGDSVVWENNWARLEVWPHTSYNILTHVQYANLTWKLADNDIDVAFRFDVPISNGKIWRRSGDDWIPVSMYLTEYNDKYYYRHDNFHVVQNGFYQFKWQYLMPVNSSGKWELLGKLSSDTIQEAYSSGRYIMLDPWWDSTWTYCRTITISNTYVDNNLGNFPILVVINKTIGDKCDGGDSIRFVDNGDSFCHNYEIEGNWSTTGNSFAWVSVNLSSSVDTIIKMYYNNSAAADAQNPTGVWNSNYVAVYHMNDSTPANNLDSTSNDNDVASATGDPTRTTGKMGYGVDFDGDDYLTVTTSASLYTPNGFTAEVWLESSDQTTSNLYLFGKHDDATHREWHWARYGGAIDRLNSRIYDESTDGLIDYYRNSVVTDDGIFHLLTATWDGDPNIGSMKLYKNDTECTVAGDDVETGDFSNLDDESTVLTIGTNLMDNAPIVGKMDEVRISKINRNLSWIKASYHTMNRTTGFLTWGSEFEETGVITNATAGIELTNATARGYFFGSGFSGNYNYGFWIGQTTPVTEGNAEQNVTGVGTITAPNEFSYNILSLSKGTHYYVWAWVMNSTGLMPPSTEDDFYTKCDPPTGFTATLSGCNVDIAWTKGTGADKTTIVRKANTYPANTTDGTVVYNNTASAYEDTTAAGMGEICYRAWSWAGDKHSDENASANLSVPPCPPTNVDGAILSNKTLNITWTKGTGASTTLVIRKSGSSPSSRTDGTEIYNNSGTNVVETDLTQDYFYRLWSYANETYSTSVSLRYGALVINCYDEETNGSLYFDVFISNESGSETYESLNNTNSLVVNVADLPIGDQISIRVSAASNYSDKSETFTYSFDENETTTYIVLLQVPESKTLTNVTCTNTSSGTITYPAFTLDEDVVTILADVIGGFDQITVNYTHYEYESRTYYRDLTTNHIFVLNAYLPSADDKILCRITVIDEISQAVDDAHVEIMRNINGSWATIASRYTDGNGQVDVFLVDGVMYKFVISKTGYITEYSDWTPSEAAPTHTFQLEGEEIEPDKDLFFDDYITFNGYTDFATDTLYVNYTDALNKTLNTAIYIYEYNYSTYTSALIYSDTRTGDYDFQISTSINSSNAHVVILYVNHTNFGFVTRTIFFEGNITTITTPARGESLFTLNYKSNPFGWTNTITWFILLIIYFNYGQRDAGIGLIFSGIFLLFINSYVGFTDVATTAAGGGIPILHIVVGIIAVIRAERKQVVT